MTSLQNLHLFILSTNNGGSTLLAQLLSRCRNIIELDSPLHEGQHVEGVGQCMPMPVEHGCPAVWTEQMSVFKDDTLYDWERIKNLWTNNWYKNQKYKLASPAIFLEKSPPDVLRADLLDRNFPDSHFITLVRDPYAVAEGINRRYKYSMERCIAHWIKATRQQIENIELLDRNIWLTYEQLCDSPEDVKNKIISFMPGLEDIDMTASVKLHSIHGVIQSGLQNYNAKQVARLSNSDIEIISKHLRNNTDVLDYFGYKLLQPSFEEQQCSLV